jgi:hypothetical protein
MQEQSLTSKLMKKVAQCHLQHMCPTAQISYDGTINESLHLKADDESWLITINSITELLEPTVTALKDLPYKESDKPRVAFMVDSLFIGNHSGIFTFLRHFQKLALESGWMLDIISDASLKHDGTENVFPDSFDTSNVSCFVSDGVAEKDGGAIYFTPETADKEYVEFYRKNLSDYLKMAKPKLLVTHSYSTTKAVHEMYDEVKELVPNVVAYTHIGDIMDENNIESLDFGSELTLKYINLLNEIEFPVGTQTQASHVALSHFVEPESVKLLPEPYYEGQTYYATPDNTKGVLIISSFYDRKRFELMFEVLGIAGLPVTVVTGLDEKDGVTLRELAIKNDVQGYRQLNNIPNEFLNGIIKQHRCLLHLSDIEVMPYAILEASAHIPCVVNGNAPWAREELPCPVYRVDVDNLFECVSTLVEVYGDTFEYKAFNVENYAESVLSAWSELVQ